MFNKILVALISILIVACSGKDEINTKISDGSSFDKKESINNANNFDTSSISYLKNKIGDRVFFGYDQYILTPEAQEIISNQASWIKKYSPENNIIIEGHCDERGTREYNIALGAKRAAAVKRLLISKGVSNKIKTISYGKERPEIEGSNSKSWALNRRSVLVIR